MGDKWIPNKQTKIQSIAFICLHSFVALGVTFDPEDNSFIRREHFFFFTLKVPQDLLPALPCWPLRFHDSGSFVDVSRRYITLTTIKMIKEAELASIAVKAYATDGQITHTSEFLPVLKSS